MSSNCVDQYCSADCCNIYGYCPTYTGGSSYSSCYYYYDDYSYVILSWWIWTLIGVGIFLFVVSVIAIIVCCCRACSRTQLDQEVVIDNTNPSINTGYYNNGYNQGYDQNYAYNNQYQGQANVEMNNY